MLKISNPYAACVDKILFCICMRRSRLAIHNFARSIQTAVIASVELATKILREFACMSRGAPRALLSFKARRFFGNSSLLVRFRCLRVRLNVPLYLRSTCLRSPPPLRRPRIAVKGVSRCNFRPVRFYRTPLILNLAFIVRNTYV